MTEEITPLEHPDQWSHTEWTHDELFDKTVKFHIRNGDSLFRGKGYFIPYQNDRDDRLRVTLWSQSGGWWHNLVLMQDAVDCIARNENPDEADFRVDFHRP